MAGFTVRDVKVTMGSDYSIATQVFGSSSPTVRRAWNRTQQVAAVARRTAPMRTGKLRRRIYPRKSPLSRPDEPVFEVVSPVHYSAPQELGFRHYMTGRFVPGKHFLRNANRSVRW